MIFTPTRVYLVSSGSEGLTTLNAFDKALMNVGLADYNLVKVSSVFPPGATMVDRVDLPVGSLVPSVYTSCTCEEPGVSLAAAISVGIPADRSKPGVIMEYSGRCSPEGARSNAERMVRSAMEARSIGDYRVESTASGHKVESCGCALAVLFLLP